MLIATTNSRLGSDTDVSMKKPASSSPHNTRPTNLKMLAAYLNLSPSTISFVLNDSPGRSIPAATRERVKAAAAKFNYQPSMIARTLQGKRMQTVGVLLPELGEGYHSQVLSGVGDLLIREGYFYFTAIDTHLDAPLPLPTVLVAGHTKLPGVTNVILDHQLAAKLALRHLYELGHRKIAFMQGQPFSSDSDVRWASTLETARELGLEVSDA